MVGHKGESHAPLNRRPPATTPEARENQMISLAVDVAERQLLDGSASAQVVTHFLKLATGREALEREKLRKENVLLEARAQAIESSKHVEELYSQALSAMKSYQGASEDPDDYED